jgi:acyl-CoA reductase-like NAD-dependent aldehyde dehydrogenase
VSTVATGSKPEYRHFIAGRWVGASAGETFDDLDPYTGEVVATVAAGTREDAACAVQAAADAFPAWSQAPPAERQADADVGYAVDAAAFGAFLHQGQICMSARRVIVDRTVADEFTGRLAEKTAGLKTGDPSQPDTVIGPLINERALETVASRVRDAVAQGARVLAGGERVGRCFQATLLADVPPDSELASVETFGPVASVEVVDGADQAVQRANDTPYGLAAGILTSDPDRGLALADRLHAGIVHVNDQPVHDEPQMPFGGVKDSGWGRFGGAAATEEFTELKWVTVQSGTRPFPF